MSKKCMSFKLYAVMIQDIKTAKHSKKKLNCDIQGWPI